MDAQVSFPGCDKVSERKSTGLKTDTEIFGYQSDEYANPLPEMFAHVSITNNSPVCAGNTIMLSGGCAAGVSYTWTGPGNFSSNSQNVIIPATLLSAGIYTLSVELTTGCISTESTGVIVNGCNDITLNIKMYIEGYYLGIGQMRAVLFNQGISIDPTSCDTVTVELHDMVFPYSAVTSSKSVLHTNGTLQTVLPPIFINHSYYLVIRHRNSIETWSKYPVTINSPLLDFDFTGSEIISNTTNFKGEK